MSDERQRQEDEREWRLAYLRRHAPAPRSWQRSALGVLDPSFAGAWVEWAMESFDDATTWLGYLRRYPAAPPEWDLAVRKELSWLFGEP